MEQCPDHHTVSVQAREELHGNTQSMSTPEVKDILVLAVPGLDTCRPSTEPQPHVLDNTEVTAVEVEIAAPGQPTGETLSRANKFTQSLLKRAQKRLR